LVAPDGTLKLDGIALRSTSPATIVIAGDSDGKIDRW
jgi:hypothetical protein